MEEGHKIIKRLPSHLIADDLINNVFSHIMDG